jgi:hypothetical protein
MTNKNTTPAIVNANAKPVKAIVPLMPRGPELPERQYDGDSARDVSALLDMLTYRRQAGTRSHRRFNRRFIQPVFGAPDIWGNYMLTIGDAPRIAFMAHHDSVHREKGIQKLETTRGYVHLAQAESHSSCLGADCATGIWLILEMVAAGIPGVYVIHADEESGCKGSHKLAGCVELWAGIDAAISFDRKGTGSIITYQSATRTCSDQFAESLSGILGLGMECDTGGSYTDSNEYVDVIAECTNLSVGYYAQHTTRESQDLQFAALLADRLIAADWTRIEIARKPGDTESLYPMGRASYWQDEYAWGRVNRRADWQSDSFWNDESEIEERYYKSADPFGDMVDLIADNPEIVADILERFGYGPGELAREIGEAMFGIDDKGRI